MTARQRRFGLLLSQLFLLMPGLIGLAGCGRKTVPLETRSESATTTVTYSAPVPDGAGTPPDTVKINDGLSLPVEDYDLLWQDYLARAQAPADADREQLREKFHRQILQDQLLLREARRVGIHLTPEFKFKRLSQDNQLLIELLKQRMLKEIEVSPEEIESYYREHLDELSPPERVQVRHILVESEAEAQKILERLQQGADFAELAREYSKHPSRENGGSLPTFSRGTYSETFEHAAFSLKVGELSGIVKTDLGYHIIEQTAFQPRKVPPLEEVRAEIERRILDQKYQEQYIVLMQRLRHDAGVEAQVPANTPD